MKCKDVIITCDSACDLTKKLLNKSRVKAMPIQITLGDDTYKDNGSINPNDIYKAYRDKGMIAKTAAFAPQTAIDFWEPYINKGYEVIHISIGSGFSSCCQNAIIASEEYNGVYVVDSENLSAGIGLITLEACKLRDRGFSAQEIFNQLEQFKRRVSTSFIIDNIEFLHKGGRCSAVAALGANVLQLKPCVECIGGELRVTKKYRGSVERVYLKYLAEKADTMVIDTNYDIFMISSGEIEKKYLDNMYDVAEDVIKSDNIHVIEAGCTICSHCGPKTFGIIYVKKQ